MNTRPTPPTTATRISHSRVTRDTVIHYRNAAAAVMEPTTTHAATTTTKVCHTTKRKQTATAPDHDEEDDAGSMKERKLRHPGVKRSSTDTNADTHQIDQEPGTMDQLSTTVTVSGPSTGFVINHMQWSHGVRTATAAATGGGESSSCEADPVINVFRERNVKPCPEEHLSYLLRDYFHSSLMTSLGLQPYFTIPTINIIFDYLWTGPAVFGSRGFKFKQHWDLYGNKLQFNLYFPYELLRKHDPHLGDVRPKLPIYHSLEMIGHLHSDKPIEYNGRYGIEFGEVVSCDRTEDTDPTVCSWWHFMNKSMDEIRLEDYHLMTIEDQQPPEFSDIQLYTGQIDSFEPWSRIWRFDNWFTLNDYMYVYGTRLTMDRTPTGYAIMNSRDRLYRRLACRQHQVDENDYQQLESKVGSPINYKLVGLTSKEYQTKRSQLQAIQATEKELRTTLASTPLLFKLSIVHDQLRPADRSSTCPARSLGRTRHQYKHVKTDNQMRERYAASVLAECFETIYHAYSDKLITYSLRMNLIKNSDTCTRTLYIGWSTVGIESKLAHWEMDFLDLPAIKQTTALVKVQIQCQEHPPDRLTQTMIITSLSHPTTEIYRSSLPDIRIEKIDGSSVYRNSDIPNPLITCELKEIESVFNSSQPSSCSMTSEATSSTVRQFIVRWLVNGVEANQQPLYINCDTPESKSVFIDEICQPILYTSLGVEYELFQQLGPNPYWRPGYFPINFDQAKLLPPPKLMTSDEDDDKMIPLWDRYE